MYRGRLVPGNFCVVSAAPDEPTCHQQASSTIRRAEGAGAARAKRIACVVVADFAVAAIARANPELRERPFALIRMPTHSHLAGKRKAAEYQPHSELSCVSPAARAAGVRPAMTVAQARTLLPDLIVTHPSPAAERATADALLDLAESMSPVVEAGAPGCVWLDLAGLQRLYRHSMAADEAAADVEDSLAAELLRRAHRLGLEAAAAIASSKELAYLAARCGGVRVIAAGMEREFLDWLPLDLVELDAGGRDDEIELMLKRLGIHRLGDIARLDIRAVGSRFGRRGVELARLARGEGSATLVVRPHAEIFTEAAEFEYGIENLEPLSFVLRAMLTQLTERLHLRGFAAGAMTLALGLADNRRDARRVPVTAATLEVRSLLTLLKLSLEASPPPAAVEAIQLTVEARAIRPAQNDLFLPPSPAPERLEAAIARIAALCGPEQVGALMPADSYRPEALHLGKFAPPPAEQAPAPGRGQRLSDSMRSDDARATSIKMVLRTIRPAEELEVMCTRNTPEFVRGKNICARVVSSAGPWRRQGEWWALQPGAETAALPQPAASAYARDYYELALADGAVYRVYCDLYTGKWLVDGVYD